MLRRALKLAHVALLLTAALPSGVALANDTTLNLNVYPPRPLATEDLPVRMKSEHITIHFGRDESTVNVEFVFENLEDSEVSSWVGFPDEDLLNRYLSFIAPEGITSDSDAWTYYNMNEDELGGPASGPDESRFRDFKMWSLVLDAPEATAEELPYKIVRIERLAASAADLAGFPNGKWESQEDVNGLLICRAFELTWQPKQSLLVGHSYKTDNGSNVLGQTLFQYTLQTGGNWRGTIGRADIDIYLEDGWKASDLRFRQPGEDESSLPFTTPVVKELEQINDTHLSTTWRDFEPQGERGWVFIATNPTYPGGEE